MDTSIFYNHVHSWIGSYYNADALDWLRKFVQNSQQPEVIKQRLVAEIDRKQAQLNGMPYFGVYQNERWLMEETNFPSIFTTRFSAISKVIELKRKGYVAELVEGNAFFRIRLLEEQTQTA